MLAVLATSVRTVVGTFTVYTYLGVFLPGVAGLGLQGLVLVLLGSSAWPVRSAPGSAAARRTAGARATVDVGRWCTFRTERVGQ